MLYLRYCMYLNIYVKYFVNLFLQRLHEGCDLGCYFHICYAEFQEKVLLIPSMSIQNPTHHLSCMHDIANAL